MDIITYGLCKKIATAALSGISSISTVGTSLIITTKNGQTVKIDFPKPKDGVGITDIEIDSKNQLKCYLTNGLVLNAGVINTIEGKKGEQGEPGLPGKDGQDGKEGKTPVKGTDYFTSEDINSIVKQVIEDFPDIEINNDATIDDIDDLFKDI